MHINLVAKDFTDYQLLDSAEGRKCELLGKIKVERHSPQAIWVKKKFPQLWNNLDANCIRKKDGGGEWKFFQKIPENFIFNWESYNQQKYQFQLKLTSFGHCGIFFEQAPIWNIIAQKIQKQKDAHFLNLFGYTGAASIVAAKSGALCTHIDSAKGVLNWGKVNAELNKIENSKIKWIQEDVLVFIKNAIKRNLKFDGILADPPSWGHGVKNEVWNFEKNMGELMLGLKKILKPDNSFLILTSHTHGVQAQALHNLIQEHFNQGEIQFGDLGVKHTQDDRILPAGLYALFQQGLK